MATRQVTKTSTYTELVCDRCGQTGHFNFGSGGKCSACGRHVCGRCNVHDPDDYGDCPLVWCKECWEIGSPYRQRLDVESAEHERRCEMIRDEWARACRPEGEE